jgi:hypothetical protein
MLVTDECGKNGVLFVGESMDSMRRALLSRNEGFEAKEMISR